MLKNQFSNESILRAQKIIMRAKREGLPVEPIINKSYEGMAKRVPQERIILAMEKVLNRYALAYQKACKLTEDKTRRSHITEEVAECIAAGMTENDVDRIVHQLDYRVHETSKDDAEGLATETFKVAKEAALPYRRYWRLPIYRSAIACRRAHLPPIWDLTAWILR
jgi:hypothetical protein